MPGIGPSKQETGSSSHASSTPLILAAQSAGQRRILRVRKKTTTIGYCSSAWSQRTRNSARMLSQCRTEHSTELTCPGLCPSPHFLWDSMTSPQWSAFRVPPKLQYLPSLLPSAAPYFPPHQHPANVMCLFPLTNFTVFITLFPGGSENN